MKEPIPEYLQAIIKTSQDMWQKGWAEANGGNISLRLEKEKAAGLKPKSDWIAINETIGELKGETFLITGTGRYLRNIALFPDKNVGVIELDDSGSRYRILYGFEPTGGPTSELSAHLKTHGSIKTAFNDRKRAVIHTHAPNLIALTYSLDLDTPRLSKLLWQSHVECIVGFPQGIEFIPWMMAGSTAIGDVTAQALRKRPLALWQFHGVFGTGRNLDEAFGLIDMADKAASIYLTAMGAGGVTQKPTTDQLIAIAKNFKGEPEAEFLKADTEPYFVRRR
jgi:rhamnulose-1-phosphate aldolase